MTAATDVEHAITCHCPADPDGHAPGAGGCAVTVKATRPSLAKDWTPADTYAELARVAGTADERARWKRQAAMRRGIERAQAELNAGESRVRRSLRVVKAGGRWAVLHVPSDAMLLGGFGVKRTAEASRENLIGVAVRWTDATLSDVAKAAVQTRAKADQVVVGEVAQ